MSCPHGFWKKELCEICHETEHFEEQLRLATLTIENRDAIIEQQREAYTKLEEELRQIKGLLKGGFKTQWIPVSSRVPEDQQIVAVWDPENPETDLFPARWSEEHQCFFSCLGWFEMKEITHWCPFPASPDSTTYDVPKNLVCDDDLTEIVKHEPFKSDALDREIEIIRRIECIYCSEAEYPAIRLMASKPIKVFPTIAQATEAYERERERVVREVENE